jgi:hypothetical protein
MKGVTEALSKLLLGLVLVTSGCFNKRNQVTEDVLAFLNAKEWLYVNQVEEVKSGIKNITNEHFKYSNFVYDKTTETLTFRDSQKLIFYTSYPQNDQSVTAKHWYRSIQIHLKTANPVIELVSPRSHLLGKDSEYVGVQISSGMEWKSAEKEYTAQGQDYTLYVTAIEQTEARRLDWEVLKQEAFGKYRPEASTTFWVTKDNAPRLKAALSDLIEAHDVRVSKY